MNHLHLAFIIGFFGSLHCVGMCAPLAFSLPTHQNRIWVVVEKLSYNLGRAVSYALLGLLIG
ncbi:MAG: sulfite exporter TauE/SafE family protein, partial [Chryseobacterium sp.]